MSGEGISRHLLSVDYHNVFKIHQFAQTRGYTVNSIQRLELTGTMQVSIPYLWIA